jgi:hypothetical protein
MAAAAAAAGGQAGRAGRAVQADPFVTVRWGMRGAADGCGPNGGASLAEAPHAHAHAHAKTARKRQHQRAGASAPPPHQREWSSAVAPGTLRPVWAPRAVLGERLGRERHAARARAAAEERAEAAEFAEAAAAAQRREEGGEEAERLEAEGQRREDRFLFPRWDPTHSSCAAEGGAAAGLQFEGVPGDDGGGGGGGGGGGALSGRRGGRPAGFSGTLSPRMQQNVAEARRATRLQRQLEAEAAAAGSFNFNGNFNGMEGGARRNSVGCGAERFPDFPVVVARGLGAEEYQSATSMDAQVGGWVDGWVGG